MTGALQRDHDAKAQRILAHLKAHLRYDNGHLPRPFFVELTGSPSAGKTTTITELYKYLRRLGFRVLRPQEGAEVIQHIPRSTPVYNVRTAIYAWTILTDESYKHTYDIILLDRGLFDAYGWMMYWRDKGELTEEEQRIIQSFFLMPFWLDSIDAAYIMVCDPEEAMRREMRIALSQRMGETTNPGAIAKLIDRYTRAFEQLKGTHPQLELVNTTHLQEQEMVDLIATRVLDTLDAKVKEA
ncbi:MAG TPA: AAA family ATPase [Candidatus Paceibacterota bacterium]|nr:AAA family ATPase [Candidatus Paceibacterota bacterium]